MTLPPVVTDPEWCAERMDTFARMAHGIEPVPHDWYQEPVGWEKHLPVTDSTPRIEVCRFCGGRRA